MKDHITISSITPGPFESKMMAYRLDDPNSRAGAFTTGSVIPVDGGISTL